MKFSDLLSRVTQTAGSKIDSGLCFDSRKLKPGCIFVAVRGGTNDGHQFLPEASLKKAAVVVVEDTTKIPEDFKGEVVQVANTREALNQLASRASGEPSKKLFCVGVTGTNGKTTTSHVVEAILNERGWATGVIGTIDHHLRSAGNFHEWKTEMTTPDPISFQERLAEFVSLGAQALAMEVSSHALHQSRVDEVPFDVALFTNLTRDHLDYHHDMANYFAAKRKLFVDLLARSEKPKRTAIVNGDDEYGLKLKGTPGVTTWTYGATDQADLSFRPIDTGFGGTRFQLRTPAGERDFFVRMPGLHNVYNASAAIGSGLAAGASLDVCAKALDSFVGVRGRLESVPNTQGLHIFVDYAHTDDAIRTILHYLGGIRSEAGLKNKIITVFGCGGDRDKGKRPLMMKAAAAGSDLVVLTSDNPRTENPEEILRDAAHGVHPTALGKTVFQVVDRRQGIAKAIELASPGDVVVIAGKGHEDYQIIGTTRFPFSDVAVVKEFLK
jgi:UDP-N-acetylmuramoyl-L-alanyl-D-glutamate--2,6-diaminopimelate ligase